MLTRLLQRLGWTVMRTSDWQEWYLRLQESDTRYEKMKQDFMAVVQDMSKECQVLRENIDHLRKRRFWLIRELERVTGYKVATSVDEDIDKGKVQ